MEPSTSTRPKNVMSTSTALMGWIFAAVLVTAAFVMPVVDKVNNELLGGVMNVVGALLIAAGLYAFARAPWVAVALVTLGAMVGSLPILQLLFPPIAIIVLVVLIVRDALHSTSVAGSDRLSAHP